MESGQCRPRGDRGAVGAAELAAAMALFGAVFAAILGLNLPGRVSCSISNSVAQLAGEEADRAVCTGAPPPSAHSKPGGLPPSAQGTSDAQGTPGAPALGAPITVAQTAATRAAVDAAWARNPDLLQSVGTQPGTGVVLVEVAKDADQAQAAQFTAEMESAGSVSVTRATAEVVIEDPLLLPGEGVDGAGADIAGSELPAEPEELRSGMAIHLPGPGLLCTTAFPLIKDGKPYFLTAGHCMKVGDEAFLETETFITVPGTGRVGPLLGKASQSTYTERGDFAIGPILTDSYTPSATVETFGGAVGGDIPIVGQEVAEVGEEVCGTGVTTKMSCGHVISFDTTLKSASGITQGLTTYSRCTLGGDSGGPVFTRDGQAQGIHHGSSENHYRNPQGEKMCPPSTLDRGTGYFTPIASVLEATGATLMLTPS